MNPTIHPHSWSEFPAECLYYLVPMSVAHLAVFAIGVVVVAALAIKQPGTFRRRVGRLGLFLALLLIAGSLINGLWSCTVWGRLYYSTDYVFDFTPVWPITQQVIDMPFGDQRGQLFGVTLTQLQMIWLLFALGTWGVTALSYRAVHRRLRHTDKTQAA
jgi:hypothetical protein